MEPVFNFLSAPSGLSCFFARAIQNVGTDGVGFFCVKGQKNHTGFCFKQGKIRPVPSAEHFSGNFCHFSNTRWGNIPQTPPQTKSERSCIPNTRPMIMRPVATAKQAPNSAAWRPIQLRKYILFGLLNFCWIHYPFIVVP